LKLHYLRPESNSEISEIALSLTLTYLLRLDRTIARLTYCNSDLSFKFRSHNRTTYLL